MDPPPAPKREAKSGLVPLTLVQELIKSNNNHKSDPPIAQKIVDIFRKIIAAPADCEFMLPKHDQVRRNVYMKRLYGLWRIHTGKDDNEVYQISYSLMETLRKEFEKTHTPPARFGLAYAISMYRTFAKTIVPQNLKKPASFRHLALVHEQYEYVAIADHYDRISEEHQDVQGGTGVEKGKPKDTLGKAEKQSSTRTTELNYLVTALCGSAFNTKLKKFDEFFPDCDVLGYIFVHPPGCDNPQSYPAASVPMVIMTDIVMFTRKFNGSVSLLARMLVAALEKPNADTTPLDFVFLLEAKETCQKRARPPPVSTGEKSTGEKLSGEKSSGKKSGLLKKRLRPDGIEEWMKGPMKNAAGEIIPGQPKDLTEGPSVIHPCGVEIDTRHTHHTTIKQIFARLLVDEMVLEKFNKLMPGEVSDKVLNPSSKVGGNLVLAHNVMDYFCTRVVARGGLAVDNNSTLCFRIY